MRTHTLRAAAPIVALAALLLVPTAQADILDDIFGAVNTCISRSTAARDRAIEARDNAADARDNAVEIADTIRTAVQTLTGQMRQIINDSVSDIQGQIAEELDGRDDFVNGPQGEQFRQDLVTLLERLEALFNALAQVADPGGPPPVSFEHEIQVVQALPLRALYPLYRVATASEFVSQRMLDRLDQATTAIEYLTPLIRDDSDGEGDGGGLLDYELSSNTYQLVAAHPTAVKVAAGSIRTVGYLVKGGAVYMKARGQVGLTDLKIGIHGYVGTQIKADWRMTIGHFLDGTADVILAIANTATNKMRQCILIGGLAELRENQNAILANQEAIIENQQKIFSVLTRTGTGARP